MTPRASCCRRVARNARRENPDADCVRPTDDNSPISTCHAGLDCRRTTECTQGVSDLRTLRSEPEPPRVEGQLVNRRVRARRADRHGPDRVPRVTGRTAERYERRRRETGWSKPVRSQSADSAQPEARRCRVVCARRAARVRRFGARTGKIPRPAQGGTRHQWVWGQLVLPCKLVNEGELAASGHAAADEDMRIPCRQVDVESCRREVASVTLIRRAGEDIAQGNPPAFVKVR